MKTIGACLATAILSVAATLFFVQFKQNAQGAAMEGRWKCGALWPPQELRIEKEGDGYLVTVSVPGFNRNSAPIVAAKFYSKLKDGKLPLDSKAGGDICYMSEKDRLFFSGGEFKRVSSN